MKNKYSKIFTYVKHYRLLIFTSFALSVITVLLSLYIPILAGEAIDLITEHVDFEGLFKILIAIVTVALITAALQWIMNIINNRVTYHVVRDLRRDAFAKIQKLPIRYIDNHPYGEIINRMISDTDTFAEGLLLGFSQLFTGITTILATLIFMFSKSTAIALVVVLITPLSFIVSGFIAKRTFHMFHNQSKLRAEQTAFTEEMISGQKLVHAYGREDDIQKQFDDINERLEKCSLSATFFSSTTNPTTRFINSLVYAGAGLAGALSVINGNLTIGGLSCFLSYANQYTKPFNEISGVITELQNAFACAVRIFELIEETPQIPDLPNAKILSNVSGKVEFDNVSFSYTPKQKLITDFNFTAHPGQKIAIVGPTGCGKTTLINLLIRFYDTTKGSILIDGTDIKYASRKSLRQSFGMVLQDSWLRHGTIKENITIAKPEASDAEIIAAAKASHAHSFIKRLPNGYDTVIGEDGGSLSQGQKQLLCITRIMLSPPPILILDEATSSIDTRTELKIQDAFSKLMKGRTSFIIAHRLSTIKDADVILVMKDGDIIEQGSHEELLKADGFYTHLYSSQFENNDL